MKVLIACEFSGIVREAFRARGHDAWSCDLKASTNSIGGNHYEGDVRHWLRKDWDLIIAHPPCTFLCNSGVRWLTQDTKGNEEAEVKQDKRWSDMYDAALFFKMFLDLPCPNIAVENPIMHPYALEWVGRKRDQIIQPWQFGHTEKKATCLWLKGLPYLEETNNVKDIMLKLPKKEQNKVHYASPGKGRSDLRSITYQGIANAMAEQWGNHGN